MVVVISYILSCSLQLVKDSSWLPDDSCSGRLAQGDMLLGPLFAVSGLVEDSAAVKSNYMGDGDGGDGVDYQGLATTIQQRLSICRVGNRHRGN